MADTGDRAPAPQERCEVWLVSVDATELLPDFLFSRLTAQIGTPAGLGLIAAIAHAPFSSPSRSPLVEAYANATWLLPWVATLYSGGTLEISAFRATDRRVWLRFAFVQQESDQRIDIEICPPLDSLRDEWDRRYPATADIAGLKEAFAELVLAELPFAAVLPSPPAHPMAGSPSVAPEWIVKELVKRNLPVADEDGYTALDGRLSGLDTPVLLVSYTPRQEPAMLQQWTTWVQRNVRDAFRVPLLSGVNPPNLPRSSVVEVALEDLLNPVGLAEIEVDVAEAEQRLRDGFAQSGTEALGWYQPYHLYDADHWGIYLHSERIVDQGAILRERLIKAGCPRPRMAFEVAVRLVLEHELFHARMETYALEQELCRGRPVFRPYQESVYRPSLCTPQALEEAVANYVARQATSELVESWKATRGWNQAAVDEVMNVVDMFYDLSPPGYRDWYIAGDSQTWRRLANQAVTGSLDSQQPLPPLDPFLESLPLGVIDLSQIPIWMTTEDSVPDKLFGVPTRREVERLLRERGYTPRPGKGSHEVWQSTDGRHFALPAARTLSRLVFRNLLHHLELSKEQYLSLRSAL